MREFCWMGMVGDCDYQHIDVDKPLIFLAFQSLLTSSGLKVTFQLIFVLCNLTDF
jgi:hypothetical protein